MTTDNTTIGIDYSDARLRVLVEEYITQQRNAFTLKDVCSYVLYWAMEEGKATQSGNVFFESDKICQADCARVSNVLSKIAGEGRIIANGESFEKLEN